MAAFAEAHLHSVGRSPIAGLAAAPPPDVRGRIDTLNTRSLTAIVVGEIVPRLILAHTDGAPPVAAAQAPVPDDLDVARFAPLTIAADTSALLGHVDRLLAQGIAVDRLMVELLAPAARLLGSWWEEDRCDFIEVTMGLWRLQEIVRDISHRVAPPVAGGSGRRALFAAFPGDQHDLGAVMMNELFHRHGWDADMVVAADMPALLAAVGHAPYDLVGLTISCDCHSAKLPSAILALRSVSCNPHVRVMVGGRVLNEDPTLARRAGADATASDARDALRLAEALVDAATRDGAAYG